MAEKVRIRPKRPKKEEEAADSELWESKEHNHTEKSAVTMDNTVGDLVTVSEEQKTAYKSRVKTDVKRTVVDKKIRNIYEELTELEMAVLEIARDIIKKKRFPAEFTADRIERSPPMLEFLYSKAVGKLQHRGYTKEEIFDAIRSLEKKRWLVTGYRLTKDEILSNDIKRKILEFIRRHPGIHARDPLIKKELGISRNPFVKHVMMLEAFGFIRATKIGSTLNYFPSELPAELDKYVAIFRNKIVREIIEAYLIDGGTTLMGLSEKLGVFHRAVQYHIEKLIELGVLIKITPEEWERKEGKHADSRRKYYKVNTEILEKYNKYYDDPPFYKIIRKKIKKNGKTP